MSILGRRRILKAGAGMVFAAGLMPAVSMASGFPSRAIKMYIPGKPGGGFDRASRAFAPAFESQTGQPFQIDFAPGAGITLAVSKMMSDRRDGHSLAYMAFSTMSVAIEGTKPAEFGHESFAHVGTVYGGPLAMFTAKGSKFKSIEQVVKESEKKPLTGAMDNARQFYHVGGLIFNKRVGAAIEYVPYGGGGPSRKAAAAGETDVVMTGLFDAGSMLDRLECLCIFAEENPIPHLVKAPTMREVFGDKAINLLHPNGLTTLASVRDEHPENYQKLVSAFKKSITSDATRGRLMSAGFPPEALIYWSPDEIDSWQKDFIAEVKKISF